MNMIRCDFLIICHITRNLLRLQRRLRLLQSLCLCSLHGRNIFNFTIRVARSATLQILVKSNFNQDHIDFFIFHQASKYMLEHLRRKICIINDRFLYV